MREKNWGEAAMLSLTDGEKERLLFRVEERLEKERPVKTEGAAQGVGCTVALSALCPDEETEGRGEGLLSLSLRFRDGFYRVSRTMGGGEEG